MGRQNRDLGGNRIGGGLKFPDGLESGHAQAGSLHIGEGRTSIEDTGIDRGQGHVGVAQNGPQKNITAGIEADIP